MTDMGNVGKIRNKGVAQAYAFKIPKISIEFRALSLQHDDNGIFLLLEWIKTAP